MQEVFEKIIEKLEEKHEQYINQYGVVGGNPMAFAVKECKEIVKQEAEQYNNGWIPCSVAMSEEHELYDVTFKNRTAIYSDEAIYDPSSGKWFWDADEVEEVKNDILAWAEKREPYQPKGECDYV